MEYEQVGVPLANLTLALLRLQDSSVLLTSSSVEGGNVTALDEAIDLLHRSDTHRVTP